MCIIAFRKNLQFFPGGHTADVIRVNQPAGGTPAQHPHAILFGDGSDGVRRQCRRRSQANCITARHCGQARTPVNDTVMEYRG